MRFRKIVCFIVMLLLVVIAGCSSAPPKTYTQYSYVIHRAVPEKPVFTVLQSYNNQKGDLLAKDVEKTLISLRLSVVHPPIKKEVEAQSSDMDTSSTKAAKSADATEQVSNDLNKGKVDVDIVTETYYELRETSADYLIYVNPQQENFKIVKKDTQEILAIDETYLLTNNFKSSVDKKLVYDLFTTLGFKIKADETLKKSSWEPTYSYITHEVVPEKPAFAVMYSYNDNDMSGKLLADATEGVLISLGLSVVSPPKKKIIESQSGNASSTSNKSSVASKEKLNEKNKEKLSAGGYTEKYKAYDDTNADYFIFVNSRQKSFKIVKKDTQEILAIDDSNLFELFYTSEKYNEQLYDIFTTLGFKVNKLDDHKLVRYKQGIERDEKRLERELYYKSKPMAYQSGCVTYIEDADTELLSICRELEAYMREKHPSVFKFEKN